MFKWFWTIFSLGAPEMTTENHTNSNFTWQVRVAVHTACNAVVILKIEWRPGYTITKGCCSSARETNKNKKVTFKLQQGLNFTVDVEFGFATMISVKQPEVEKNAYCVVFYDVKNGHFFSCTNWNHKPHSLNKTPSPLQKKGESNH